MINYRSFPGLHRPGGGQVAGDLRAAGRGVEAAEAVAHALHFGRPRQQRRTLPPRAAAQVQAARAQGDPRRRR